MHFNTEKGYMVKCNAPEYRAHQAEHKRLIFEVKALSINLEKESPEKGVEELSVLRSQWVHHHILTWDVAFAHRNGRRGGSSSKRTCYHANCGRAGQNLAPQKTKKPRTTAKYK